MILRGKWYPKDSAASHDAVMTALVDGHYELEIENADGYSGTIDLLGVENRLGNVERKITLEDGSIFATYSNDSVDEIFKEYLKTNLFIHTLESKFRWVFVALIVTVLAGFSFFKWGVPWTSRMIAMSLPEETNQMISSGALDMMDKYMLDESELNKSKKEAIRKHFTKKIASLNSENSDIKFKLHFRLWEYGDTSLPNAFALPSGDIVLTDKFVELAQSQDEIDAVLLHEMGHVVHRHGLETVIEATFISVVSMVIVGDSSGFADMGAGLGSLLISSSYSRGHESEADMYAFEKMLASDIDPASFSLIMNRMTSYMEESKRAKNKESNSTKSSEKRESRDSVLDYLSSHPRTQERIDIANRFSECYRKGMKSCDIEGSE